MGSSWLVLAASSASSARPGGFDPASTLPWSVPLLLLAPLFGFVVVITGVRGRHAASNLTMLTSLVMLVATVLIGWARLRQAAAYRVALPWINVPVSFTGDQRFQGFGVDVAISVDRYALAGLAALQVLVLVALVWHRVAGAREAGQIRYHVNVLLLMLSSAGVVVSSDLGELFAFWAVAGIASYLLLGQRWGTDAGARASRLALGLPFLGDMALLSGVGFLYSRFGSIDLTKLPPMLHTTPGVGLKSLTLIFLLLFAAVFVRACLWPFTAWLTASVDAPPSLLALVAGVWPVLAGSLLLRSMPILGAGLLRVGDFERDRNAINELRSRSKEVIGFGYEIEWRRQSSRRFGLQNMPVSISISTREDFTRLIEKCSEVREFEKHQRLICEAFPDLSSWIQQKPLRVVEHALDWDRACWL